MSNPRSVLLGMCDPHSDDPRRALSAAVTGTAGWRLWQILNSAVFNTSGSTTTRYDYERAFRRVNLVPGRTWDDREARLLGEKFVRNRQRARDIVVLGAKTWHALGFCPAEELYRAVVGKTSYYRVPHPSGRCRWYNDAVNYNSVGQLLLRLYEERGRG